jgi:hypothetical protein
MMFTYKISYLFYIFSYKYNDNIGLFLSKLSLVNNLLNLPFLEFFK